MSETLLEDFLSRDHHRIWSASHEVIKLQDLDILHALAGHRVAIEAATQGIDLGGALQPNALAPDFALKKLAFIAADNGCLCQLYPAYDGFNPQDEQEDGRVVICSEISIPYESQYVCQCTACGATYALQEGDYHIMWWRWKAK